MRRALFGVLLVGCAAPPQPAPHAAGGKASAAPPAASPQASAPRAEGSLELVESWPTETTLNDDRVPDAFEVWPRMLAGAKRSIDVAQMYVSPGDGGRMDPVLAALEAAAARGVRVRVLVDAKFGEKYPAALQRLRGHDRIELRRFEESLIGGIHHAKYFVVDGTASFIGSQNFDWRALEHIQELGVRIEDRRLTRVYAAVFERDWARAGGEELPSPKLERFPVPVHFGEDTVLATPLVSPRGAVPKGASWELPILKRAIAEAKQRIRVQLLSYSTVNYDGSTFTALQQALSGAAQRGVRVQLLLSNWTTGEQRLPGLRALARAGVHIRIVTIPQHSGGFIPFARVVHSKYAIFDGEHGWVGTSNWSGDYFTASRNLGVFVTGRAFAERLGALFSRLWSAPYSADFDPERDYPPARVAQ